MVPEVSHHPLHRADGSASYCNNLFTILASVNGPIEVQRRDELAEEAAIAVNLRPAAGITKTPALRMQGAVRDVGVLPGLVNAAFLALVDGGLRLDCSVVATLFTVTDSGVYEEEPDEKQLVGCKSVHAMAYSHRGELLLNESAGRFPWSEWEGVAERAEKTCFAAMASATGDEEMAGGVVEKSPWLRHELEERARVAVAWRETT
ncbi:exosome non-catalytic core subunit rrp46 [Recurvomyces mirabilis]|uniref:Exosome non-catalytic core subunit rrp46 n=1 Tax=Recurvomyces mirabilis TaxID=574656 RepID=A0AAE0WG16_9PEZI|nr:exosome non-catalytic core subunit rrp46 [Recurvomyces mirabilis]KAK5151660.1 exosome non-catalytic core subunit rrp46 [Recurvomyces mirabilis]